MTSDVIITLGLALALISLCLTGAALGNAMAGWARRWRKARSERKRRVWVWRILR